MDVSTILSSVVYLKAILKDGELGNDEPVLELSLDDSPVEFILNEDLVVFFLYENETGNFNYVQGRDLDKFGITVDQLMKYGISNLYDLSDKLLTLHTYDNGCYALTLEGNFEASLLLLDALWDISLLEYVSTEYVVAVPCRSVLLFCDINSYEGINEMKELIEQAWEERDHKLIKRIMTRKEGKWIFYE